MTRVSLSKRKQQNLSKWIRMLIILIIGLLLVTQLYLGRSLIEYSPLIVPTDEIGVAYDQPSPIKLVHGIDELEKIRQYNLSLLSLHERSKLRRAMQDRVSASQNETIRRRRSPGFRTQSPNGGAFIHMGKTGGSAISLLLRNGCHSFMPHPCRNVSDETEASRRIESYYHVPDFAFLEKSHHDFYIISTRDPFDRIVSAFVYQHIKNIDVRGDIDIKDKRAKYAIASACFDSLESFVLFLEGNHTDFNYPYPQYDVRPESCKDFARAVFHGRVRIFSHMFFSFRRVLSFMPHVHRQVIYATRQKHLWEDWTHINQILGQISPIKIPDSQVRGARNTSHLIDIKLPVTRDLSAKATQILCMALQEEYNAYFHWLRLARNLNQEAYDREAILIQKRCPMILVAPSS